MIIEGIVTTIGPDGDCHVAPMGPELNEPAWRSLVLKPYQSSVTYANLQRLPFGVFHVIDNVELLARAAIHHWEEPPVVTPCPNPRGFILSDACRWYGFEVQGCDASQARTIMQCRVVSQGRLREFLGFNRAKHAVVEAAILATRVGLLDAQEIAAEMARLAIAVKKTAGPQEQRAFDLIQQFLQASRSSPANH